MTERDQDDRMLEDLFAAARRRTPEPSEALMARIEADAEAEAAARMRRLPERGAMRDGFWSGLTAMLGGWPGFGGLATAAAAGLWIGYAGLADPGELSGGLIDLGGEAIELMPGADVLALATVTEG